MGTQKLNSFGDIKLYIFAKLLYQFFSFDPSSVIKSNFIIFSSFSLYSYRNVERAITILEAITPIINIAINIWKNLQFCSASNINNHFAFVAQSTNIIFVNFSILFKLQIDQQVYYVIDLLDKQCKSTTLTLFKLMRGCSICQKLL